MQIVHLNTADIVGGAGIAAYRFHSALNAVSGVQSRLLVGIKKSDDETVVPIHDKRHSYLVSRAVHRLSGRVNLQNCWSPVLPRAVKRIQQSADLIHMHHVHGGFFSYRALLKSARFKPTIWTLHDMWSFTGFCSYAKDCSRWMVGCGRCPQLLGGSGRPKILDLTAWHWKNKYQGGQRAHLTIVAPSRWLADLARRSAIHGHLEVLCIPNGVDIEVFGPCRRAEVRAAWGIPDQRIVLLAQSDRRKGSSRLQRILHGLPADLRKTIFLLIVGKNVPEKLTRYLPKDQLRATGYINRPERMAECYGLSDLFLLPTEADNLPNTLIESIACGTPAVTFKVGGCPDVIRHMETGYLADPGSDGDFSKGIAFLLQEASLREGMAINCRHLALREFGMETAKTRYLSLYESIISRFQAR